VGERRPGQVGELLGHVWCRRPPEQEQLAEDRAEQQGVGQLRSPAPTAASRSPSRTSTMEAGPCGCAGPDIQLIVERLHYQDH
jgi:hypothetical protein